MAVVPSPSASSSAARSGGRPALRLVSASGPVEDFMAVMAEVTRIGAAYPRLGLGSFRGLWQTLMADVAQVPVGADRAQVQAILTARAAQAPGSEKEEIRRLANVFGATRTVPLKRAVSSAYLIPALDRYAAGPYG